MTLITKCVWFWQTFEEAKKEGVIDDDDDEDSDETADVKANGGCPCPCVLPILSISKKVRL